MPHLKRLKNETEFYPNLCLDEEESLNFFEEDATIWIDPLDGTQAFVNGNVNFVTSIIGVSFNGVPRFGIIHKPFYGKWNLQMDKVAKSTQVKDFISRTYFGSVECGVFKCDLKDYLQVDPEIMNQYERPAIYMQPFPNNVMNDEKSYELKVTCTMNRFSQMQECLDQLKPSVNIRVGGAGNKAVHMLDGNADALVHVVKGIKYWDMCASEALMKARFGIVTNKGNLNALLSYRQQANRLQAGQQGLRCNHLERDHICEKSNNVWAYSKKTQRVFSGIVS